VVPPLPGRNVIVPISAGYMSAKL